MRSARSHRGISQSINTSPVETLEQRRLLSVSALDSTSAETVVIGTGGITTVDFTASNGQYESISSFNATATVEFSGSGAPKRIAKHLYFPRGDVESVVSINLTDAVPEQASLRGSPLMGSGPFSVGSIVGGGLSSIFMPEVALTGSLAVQSVTNIRIGAVEGAAINLGTGSSFVNILGPMSGTLTAETLGTLLASKITQEAITTTAPFARSKLDIGYINAGAGLEQSEIISAGNIGTVRAKFIDGSVITAGTNPPAAPSGQFPVDNVPEYSTAFTSEATIHSIQIIRGGTGGYFSNSVIAAYTIVSAQLAQMGAVSAGVAAHNIDAIQFMAPAGSLNLTNLQLSYPLVRTVSRLETTLTRRDVPYHLGLLGPDNILVLNLNLNVIG